MAKHKGIYMIKIKILLLIFFLVPAFSQDENDPDIKEGFYDEEMKYQVSIYEVVAKKEFFNGKKVFLTGYVNFKIGFNLFADRTSCEDLFVVNSVFVRTTKDKLEKYYNEINETCSVLSVYGTYKSSNTYMKEFAEPLSMGFLRLDKVFE